MCQRDWMSVGAWKGPVTVRHLPVSSLLQVSSMDFIAMKRSQLYGLANNPYSSPQQPGGAPYPAAQPYSSPPPPHRYPVTMQGRSQMAMGGMQYTQQQVRPHMHGPPA